MSFSETQQFSRFEDASNPTRLGALEADGKEVGNPDNNNLDNLDSNKNNPDNKKELPRDFSKINNQIQENSTKESLARRDDHPTPAEILTELDNSFPWKESSAWLAQKTDGVNREIPV